ncbi:MAG: DUF5977 domain-containing protein [Chitinophagaceae bacterium]
MVRKIIVAGLVMLGCGFLQTAKAQYASMQMPQLLPPSPEAFKLGTYGTVPVGLFTGTMRLDVPIHEVRTRNLSVPVLLSYSTNGVKVDEVASRVGTDWILNAGGMISRTIVGAEDGIYARDKPPTDFVNMSAGLTTYLRDLAARENSSEPDIYTFNFGGYSGKFCYNRMGEILWMPMQPSLKIIEGSDYTQWRFKMITPDGVEYTFGGNGATEKSRTQNGGSGCSYTSYSWKDNAWYLTKIKHPLGDSIVFKYSSVYYSYVMGFSESYDKLYPTYQPTYYCPRYCEVPPENDYFDPPSNTQRLCYTTVTNDGVILSKIEFPDGELKFNHGYRYDLTNDSSFTSVDITYAGKLVKKIKFDQDYSSTTGTYANGDISDYGGTQRLFLTGIKEENITGQSIQLYSFEYNDRTGLPSRLSRSQDHFGYFNGANNTSLAPANSEFSGLFSGIGGDRSPDFTYGSKGVMTKIVYPTGGYSKIEYEPQWILANRISYYHTGESVVNGHIAVGGARVKSVKNYTDSTAAPVVRKFYYDYWNDPDSSSGIVLRSPQYFVDKVVYLNCKPVTPPGCLSCGGATITYKVLQSNSTFPIYHSSGALVQYANVREGFGDSFENGGIFHSFITHTDALPQVMHGKELPSSSVTNFGVYNGLESQTLYYGLNGSGQVIKKKEIVNKFKVFDQFSTALPKGGLTNTNVYKADTCIYINRIGVPNCTGDTLMQPEEYVLYDIGRYYLFSYFAHQDSSYTYDYDETGNNAALTITVNKYDSAYVVKTLDKVITQLDTLETSYKYVRDFASSGNVYEKLVNANMVIAPVERSMKRNSQSLYSMKTNYTDWFSDNKVLVPSTEDYTPAGQSAITRIRYQQYTTAGMLTEVSKESDVRMSYIWDKWNKSILAEVTNASAADVAVTSFEDLGNGNWSISGGSYDLRYAYTGSQSYKLSAGVTISKSGLTSGKTYIVSYWSRSGSLTVNSGSGTAGITRNGWTYYQHSFTGATSVSITGTTSVDELRLYPQGALMSSFTYQPGVGITSRCDANGVVNYYEYDTYARLMLVRDEDQRVLKKICYNFYGQAESCPYYLNAAKDSSIRRNNCSVGYIGSLVTYSVAAGKYTSTISQADADAKARAEVIAYGQEYANANGTCTQVTIYARAEYQNVYQDLDYTTADLVLRFYSDAACTTPYSVTNLNVNYRRVRLNCGGWGSPVNTNYTASNCNGYQVNLGNVYLMLDDGIHCYEYSYNTTAGTGYTPQ